MSYKILLADDSVTVQKIVSLTFSDEGVDVVPVNNGDEAIRRVQSLRPALVMADVSIPGKNGYEICAFIKSHPELKHTPVVLLVPAFEPFDEERAARVGADHHLTKPFQSIRTLIATVKSLIEPDPRPAAEPLDLDWPTTNPPLPKQEPRTTADILQEALAQDDEAVLSAHEPDTGDLEPEADSDTEKLLPPETIASAAPARDTAKLAANAEPVASPILPVAAPILMDSAPASFAALWEDDVLELDDVLPPIPYALVVKPPAPVTVLPALNASGSITQSVKLTSVEAVTTIPPGVIDDIVNRVAAQVSQQLAQQLNQFATRISQDVVAQLAQSSAAARPARREGTDALLDL